MMAARGAGARNAIHSSFSASAENVEAFIAGIHGYLAEKKLGGLAFDMELLAREALVNAVQHGSAGDPAKTVHASLHLEPGALVLSVRDEGPGWDWRSMPTTPPDPASEAGRGLFIIRKYADTLAYNDPGNALTITKRVPTEVVMDLAQNDTIQMQLEARVSAQDVPALRESFQTHIRQGARRFLLDFSKVESLDSMGIGLLVATHNSLNKVGGALEISGINKDLHQLLTLMRLDKHISISPAKGG